MNTSALRWVIGSMVLSLFFLSAQLSSSLAQEPYEYDEETGDEINQLCAGCHGEFGEGGGDGQYPRLAGLPASYLSRQLLAFNRHERPSLAMGMYATDRELSPTDRQDISIFLSKLELMTRMPKVDPDMKALEKLYLARQVFNVPRYDGDSENGRKIYINSCLKCHGADGKGKGLTPQLAGQHTEYLRLQILYFQTGERKNKQMDKYIMPLSSEDIEALLAYLSLADD